MKKTIISTSTVVTVALISIPVLFSSIFIDNTQAGKNSVAVKNGWVTIHSEKMQVLSLLKEMADELDIELFLVTSPENKPITIEINRVRAPEALSRVLRGYDYAVVYLNPKKKRDSQGLVFMPMLAKTQAINISIDDPILNFDEKFWQTFTPHKYLGGLNIIFTPFTFGQQEERPKEITVAEFITAYEERIKLIQEELSEDYAEKEFSGWVVARAKQELEFYKAQLEVMSVEQD